METPFSLMVDNATFSKQNLCALELRARSDSKAFCSRDDKKDLLSYYNGKRKN